MRRQEKIVSQPGTQTKKDEYQIERRRKGFKKRYYRNKSEQESIQAQKKVNGANSVALAQIGASFKPHQMIKQNIHQPSTTDSQGEK